jgi:hypothetical protein
MFAGNLAASLERTPPRGGAASRAFMWLGKRNSAQ